MMKNKVLILTGMFLLSCVWLNSFSNNKKDPDSKGSINIYSTPDLSNLTSKWVDEFNRDNAKLKINFIESSSWDDIDEILKNDEIIGFSSSLDNSTSENKKIWKIIVGRDVYVPIINSDNPYLKEIMVQGIAPECFEKILKGEIVSWNMILKDVPETSVNLYLQNDKALFESLTKFTGVNFSDIKKDKIKEKEELLSSIQNDHFAIGFLKMNEIIEQKSQGIVANISLLPIDRNSNGRIDYMEKIYDDVNVLARGVWIGKYPKSLINNIYSIASTKPYSKTNIAFLKWVLSDGQKYLNTAGFSDLTLSERQLNIDKFYTSNLIIEPVKESKIKHAIYFSLMIVFSIGLIVVWIASFQFFKNDDIVKSEEIKETVSSLNFDNLLIPKGIYFDKSHTWAYLEKEGQVQIGIDDFLQHVAGKITSIDLKAEGEFVRKGYPILTIGQNGKKLTINSPISGVIKKQNKELCTNTSLLNSNPYSEGWIYKIEPSNWSRENQFLIVADKYKDWIKNEFSRLRDFLANVVKPESKEFELAVLQEGGEFVDGVLSILSPELWEEFQITFLDSSRIKI